MELNLMTDILNVDVTFMFNFLSDYPLIFIYSKLNSTIQLTYYSNSMRQIKRTKQGFSHMKTNKNQWKTKLN